MMTRSLLTLTLWTGLAALISSATSAGPPGTTPASEVFVGYVNGRPAELNLKLYTHLCHAFVVADVAETARPEQLGVDDWVRLTHAAAAS